MEREIIAIFDFDGTLTTKDTFIEFARQTVGTRKLFSAIFRNALWLIRWKLGLCEGGKAKEHLFTSLYKGMSYQVFKDYGHDFAPHISTITNTDIVDLMDRHVKAGHRVYIVSASIPEWIAPWALLHGIPSDRILGTNIAVDADKHITGRFSSPNCNGEEKVRRIREVETQLDNCTIFAYGNSSGDKPMLDLATHATMVK